MSFLLGALGQFGKALLPAAGGWLFKNVAQPLLGRIGGFFSGGLGGQSSTSIGRTPMDKLYTDGMNATFGGINRFAKSNWLQRKMPILSEPMQNASTYLRDRLDAGYRQFTGQGGDANMAEDGIERR